ncbi:hypothetical protein EPI10_000716 [Gossypium australe]|uniref:Uncharacterized protein n=1 Tax=Gossypium australe TaxID=47621 RepID=A0A5B6V8Q6_9ROSI|nr:hypothetical protein EPI10_000716 [Gossypium australe]
MAQESMWPSGNASLRCVFRTTLAVERLFGPRWVKRGHVGPIGPWAQSNKLYDCVVNIGLDYVNLISVARFGLNGPHERVGPLGLRMGLRPIRIIIST